MKNRSRKRTLTFERLETKATPAMLLAAMAPLDEETHQQVERMLHQQMVESAQARSATRPDLVNPEHHNPDLRPDDDALRLKLHVRHNDTVLGWQFSHPVVTLLQFVDENTLAKAQDSALCSPPTWDQCRAADDMMKLHDHELRTLIMADRLNSPPDWDM